MKSASTQLITHIGLPLTTLTTCIKIARTDGVEMAFTALDQEFTFADILHKVGYDPTAVESTDQMSVDNLEWQGVIDHEDLISNDFRAGVYDGATWEIYRVNWADLSQGKIILKSGTIGNIKLAYPNTFVAEGRSLTQGLQVRIGMLYTPTCKWDLGDHRCTFNLTAPDIDVVPFWEPNHAYAIGDRVKPRRVTGLIYVVNEAGTSGATEPEWEAGS